MKQSPSEAYSSSASHEIIRTSRDQKYHYSVHKSSLFVLIMSQINPIYAIRSHFFNTKFHITLLSASGSSKESPSTNKVTE